MEDNAVVRVRSSFKMVYTEDRAMAHFFVFFVFIASGESSVPFWTPV